jgi:hypothetical protein
MVGEKIHSYGRFVVRLHVMRGIAMGLLGAAAAGCASGGAAGGSQSVAMEAGSGALGVGAIQWSGRFRAIQEQSGNGSTRQLNQTTGSVVLTAPSAEQTRVQLSVSGPMLDPLRVPWVVAPGPCRSGSLALTSINQFPEISMSNGHGELDATFSMTLPTSGTYHVNVYNGTATDESGVMACAELKLERKSN